MAYVLFWPQLWTYAYTISSRNVSKGCRCRSRFVAVSLARAFTPLSGLWGWWKGWTVVAKRVG